MESNVYTIAIAADHAGYELKEFLKDYLSKKGYKILDFGTHSTDSMDYPDVAHPLAQSVESGESKIGFTICGSGNGINMTANKHQSIRAALCWRADIAALARQHNNANVCSLPARFISTEEALQITEAFLTAEFEGGRHERRVEKIACHNG